MSLTRSWTYFKFAMISFALVIPSVMPTFSMADSISPSLPSSFPRSCQALLSLVPRSPTQEIQELFELNKLQSQHLRDYWLSPQNETRVVALELRQIKAMNEIFLGFEQTEKLLKTLAIELQKQSFQIQNGTTQLMSLNFKRFLFFDNCL